MYHKLQTTIFLLVLVTSIQAQHNHEISILHFSSAHTSFPDTARLKGYTYDSVLYNAGSHYRDSSVILLVPREIKQKQNVDLIFWFHGWNNNIDTAMEFYELRKQFIASKRNAVFVLAETARNAPDSYGGKLEREGTFKDLVSDIMNELKKTKQIRSDAKVGSIVLAGHSGAFRVIAYMLQNGLVPVQEVYLFDALYSQLDKFIGWIQQDKSHHFINWFTNHGGGTDEMSIEMMKQLKERHIDYTFTEEDLLTPRMVKQHAVLFVHSTREHNVIINNPDNLQLLLENSRVLQPLH